MTHTVCRYSHWQGSGPPRPIAIAPDQATAEHVADLLSTCSFCAPGRTRHYSTGSCYLAKTVRVVRSSVPRLPDDACEWTRTDAQEWFADERS